jgi:hypothetical protein
MKEQLGYGRQKPPKYKTPVKFDGGAVIVTMFTSETANVFAGDAEKKRH